MKQKQKLTYKEILGIWTASISFALGWILVIINFFLPPLGEVADSSLWVLSQALLYTAAVIGLAQYTKGEIAKIRYQVGIKDEEHEAED